MIFHCLLLGLCFIYVHCQNVDVCSSYTLINQPGRLINNTKTADLCDRLLEKKWYRFDGAEIPFGTCVSQYHCGTHVPLWIDGSYPTASDGLVLRKACGDFIPNNNNCCDYEIQIGVKNCQKYFVYYLQPVEGCSMAYCTEPTPTCSGDKYSKSGYPPCIDAFPKLTQPPSLSNPDVKPADFEFHCHIPYPTNKHDAIFEVTWLIDGQTVIQGDTLQGSERDATLSSAVLEGHLNSNLSCSVRTSFLDNHTGGRKSPPSESNKYWIGVRYSTHVTLTQTAPEEKVTVTSTIPIVCRQPGKSSCSLNLQLTTDNENISPSTCNVVLRPTDWNPVTNVAQTTFTIGTKPSIPLTPFSQTSLHLGVNTAPGKEWNNYHMPDIKVDSKPQSPGAQCTSVGDPHYRTFDSKKILFTNLHSGQYLLVRQKHGSFRIETRTQPHSGLKASFNCAFAAREGNDVIIFDMCGGKWGNQAPRFEIKNPAMFENKTQIAEDPSGNYHVLKFQSGAIVKASIRKNFVLDIFVHVPGTFRNNTEGLCGNFDGNVDNDLQRPTGKIDPVSKYPYPFIDSWKIPHGQSLFEKAEPLPVPDAQKTYCACTNKQQCNTIPQTVPSITDICVGCKPVSGSTGTSAGITAATSTGSSSGSISTTAAHQSTVTPLPPITTTPYIFPPPTHVPEHVPMISRPDAMVQCMTVLDSYPSAKKCITSLYMMEFNEIVEMCVTDIELTGDKDMGLSALVAMMESCAFHAITDPKNIINGTFVMPVDAKVCPSACSGNGDCQNGVCACVTGYEGSDCSIHSTEPPILTAVSGGSSCDSQTQQCYRPTILGENIKANVTQCSVRNVQYSDFGSSTMDMTSTRFISEFKSTYHTICPISQRYPNFAKTQALQGFMLTLTNNGGLNESDEVMYTVYNSKCIECDDIGTCTIKKDTCMIENQCYVAGYKDDVDHQGACDPSVSNTKWSSHSPTVTGTPTSSPVQTSTYGSSQSLNHYTAVGTGCGCYFDPSRADCACCKDYGCPCDAKNPHICFDCINQDTCKASP